MLSFELNRLAKKLLNEIEETEEFTEIVATLSKELDPIFQWLSIFSENNGQTGPVQQASASIYRHFTQQVPTIPSKIAASKLYAQLHRTQDILRSFSSILPDKEIINNILLDIDRFKETYDTYLDQKSGRNAVSLVKESNLLNASMTNLNSTLKFVIDNLEGIPPAEMECETLSLLLSTDFSLHDFAQRLLAIDELYSELCNISLQVEHPIKISKIESGSLWVQVLGNPTVISLMAEVIRKGANYLYRSYTIEGKISCIPKQVEALKEIMELSNYMENLGLDTREINELNAASSVAIANSLNTLLQGQPSITVNNELLGGSKDLITYLTGAKPPLLLKEAQEIDSTESLSSEETCGDSDEPSKS
jgi:hypothetical protein